ncbi:hypothetical protein MRX96_011990 [Rhipicephalus microplus]
MPNMHAFLQPTFLGETDEMPFNRPNDSLLQHTDDSGGPEGDDVHNHANKSLATTPSYDYLHDKERQMGPYTSPRPIPIEDASAVAANCCKIISNLINYRTLYKDVIKRIICIEFASDSANYISTGGLAYNIVMPVPPERCFSSRGAGW